MKLFAENHELKEKIKHDKSRYDMLEEQYIELNENYHKEKRGHFMLQRMNDELINKELAEMRTLRDENYEVKSQNARFYRKNQSQKEKI